MKRKSYSEKPGSSKKYKKSAPAPSPRFAKRSYPPSRANAKEKKGMDTALTQASPIISTTNTNANAVVLNLVQAGTGSWNRVGRKVHLKSARLIGNSIFVYNQQATTADWEEAILRMVVVWDKQPSGGTIPTFDTIFGGTVQDGTESSSVLASVRYDNTERFRVLADCVWDLNATATGSTSNTQRISFDKYVALKNLTTVYSGQSSPCTIADISTGGLYLIFRATTNTAITTIDVTPLYVRLRYMDV